MTIIFETDRLILREIDVKADLDRWCEMMADADTVRYIGGKTLGRAECWRQMATIIGHQEIRGYGFWSVVEKSSGQFIGRVGPWFPEGWPEPEIGWTIMKDASRKGYAKEAGAACIHYAFNTLGWDRCIHVIDKDNIGSIKTAEALGSKRMYKIDSLGGGVLDATNCWAYGQVKG